MSKTSQTDREQQEQDDELDEVLTKLVSTVSPDEDGHSRYDDKDEQAEIELEASKTAKQAITKLMTLYGIEQRIDETTYLKKKPQWGFREVIFDNRLKELEKKKEEI